MNKLVLVAVSCLFTLPGCSAIGGRANDQGTPLAAQEGPHQLRVDLTGLPGEETAVRIGLYRHAAHWLHATEVFKARLLLATEPEASMTFYGLPAGTYAIAAYQDRNDNARLDRWFGLIPAEPVAFSQVSAARLPPRFADAAISVPSATAATVQFNDRQQK